MRSFLTGIAMPILFVLTCLIVISCDEETETPNATRGLIRVIDTWVPGAATRMEMWATEPLFAGYNPVTFMLYDSITNKALPEARISLSPLMHMMDKSHSCPVENPVWQSGNRSWAGAILFTMPSGEAGSWSLAVELHRENSGKSGEAVFPVNVQTKAPAPVIVFKTATEEKYILAAHFATKPVIGANNFEIVAFRAEGHSFVAEEDFEFTMNPEMPSMNHGSPNNVSPVHKQDGHYEGQVNFTMSGDWRIHLNIMKNGTSLAEKYFDVLVN